MNVAQPEKIVVLGLMSDLPWAGVVWQTIHYLIGFQKLGYDVYYVEAHGHGSREWGEEDPALGAAEFVGEVMERWGFGQRWAYDTVYKPRRVFGMSEFQLNRLYDDALLINLSGGTLPRPEHTAKDRLVYLETDPVEVQIDLFHGNTETEEFLENHFIHFSYGENLGHPDCRLPSVPQFSFRATRQPVVLDFWQDAGEEDGEAFSTVGNWSQPYRQRWFQGETFHWSKHYEFLKFIDLPRRTRQPFELALSSYRESDRQMLEGKGWRVRPALEFGKGRHFEAYRSYITNSRGEFTVAKDQNIRLRSGWFSDRAATYLAAGRPVITQETAFSNILPCGEGLFAFSTMDEILSAVEAINSDYRRHRRAAFQIAREYFAHDVVLTKLLSEIGSAPRRARTRTACVTFFSRDLVLSPKSRWPTRVPEQTLSAALSWPVPVAAGGFSGERPLASFIIAVFNGVAYTRMCLTSLLQSLPTRCEVVVVNNGSTDGTSDYLAELARLNPQVRVISNETNRGYATGVNQGAAVAQGRILVFLNNDTIVNKGVFRALKAVRDSSIGIASPVTNWTSNEAQISVSYRTYGELGALVDELAEREAGKITDLEMLPFFCAAIRREVFEQIGPLDERFEIGMFEDNDYSMRIRKAGLRIVCVEDSFVHHFGQGTIGELCETGNYEALLQKNKRLFEEKWGIRWTSPKKRITPQYKSLRLRIREIAAQQLPPGAIVLVVSKGDEELLRIDGFRAWHFPRAEDGSYPYVYPMNSSEAIQYVKSLKDCGATHLLLPEPAFWWRDYYAEFNVFLGEPHFADQSCVIFSLNA